MTTNAFVKALRGPDDTPAEISPLSYIKDAIRALDDLETAIKERDDDPESFLEATAELKVLQANLTAALAVQDQAAKTYDRDEAERHINMLYGCPGAQYEVDTGVELLHDALRKFGLRRSLTNSSPSWRVHTAGRTKPWGSAQGPITTDLCGGHQSASRSDERPTQNGR